MRKLLSVLSVVLAVFTISSCVDPDPSAFHGPAIPNSSGSNGNINGPRIITKVDSANVTLTEYISTSSGVLQFIKNRNSPDDAVVYGANNKISTLKLDHQTPNQTTLTLIYDTSGKIISSQQVNQINNTLHSILDATLTYNSAGKLNKVVKKMKGAANSQYTHYNIIDLTYSGENVTKVVDSPGFIVNGTMEPVNPVMVQTFMFENFDNKISPQTTLPKEYSTAIGLLGSVAFSSLSYNNPLKTSIQLSPMMPPQVTTHTYNYDAQNYPVSDASNVHKFYYKQIQ